MTAHLTKWGEELLGLVECDDAGVPISDDKQTIETNSFGPLIDAMEAFGDKITMSLAEVLRINVEIQSEESKLYDCGGIPVYLTLPEGEHIPCFQGLLNLIVEWGWFEDG